MKLLTTLILSVLSFLVLSAAVFPTVYADDPLTTACGSAGSASDVCQAKGSTNPISGQNGIINKVARLIIVLTGTAAVIVIIIAGLMFVLSNGDSQRIATARNAILYAFIGLLVAILAQAIISFVLPKLIT